MKASFLCPCLRRNRYDLFSGVQRANINMAMMGDVLILFCPRFRVTFLYV